MDFILGQACVTNWDGVALFYYKLVQTLLKNGATSLLQIRAKLIIDWSRYYKLG